MEEEIYKSTKGLKFDEVKNNYNKFLEFLDKQKSFVTKHGIPKSFLRILNYLNENIYEENLEE